MLSKSSNTLTTDLKQSQRLFVVTKKSIFYYQKHHLKNKYENNNLINIIS
jgi:TolB-like protein